VLGVGLIKHSDQAEVRGHCQPGLGVGWELKPRRLPPQVINGDKHLLITLTFVLKQRKSAYETLANTNIYMLSTKA
jgi:hypothetical protein